jgi:hypothetical protein
VFGDRTAAAFAGFILLLIPQQILWSATAAVEPSASLACVAAVLCAASFCDSKTPLALAGTGAAAAYAAQFRPESFLIVPVIALLLWRCLTADQFTRVTVWAIALMFVALVATHVGHMTAVRNEGWGTNDARLSLAYVFPNLRVNGAFYVGDERFPWIVTLLAAAGLIARRFPLERLCFAAYFMAFFGIYLMFYAGSYNYGADVRYSLLTFPPLAVLGGLGASRMARWLERRVPGLRAAPVIAAGLAFQFLWYAPVVRATTEEAWAARADVRFARSFASGLRGNSYVLTHNPGMFHVWGVNAGQMSSIVNNPGQLQFLGTRYDEVYLHWNFWCNVQDPVQQGFCLKALAGKPFEVVREYRERGQRFALYRLRGTPPEELAAAERPDPSRLMLDFAR